jgi:arylsulfatase A-like enzyme
VRRGRLRAGARRLALALLVLSLAAPSCTRRAAAPPRILLVSIDSLRADHVGCYGYACNTTPRLDRLASEGARFATAVSTSSWTLPAHMSLLTGLLPSVHGLQRTSSGLDAARTLVGEIFRDAGVRTAGFVSSPYLDERYGFARGFETYRNLWGASDSLGASRPDGRVYASAHGDRTGAAVIDSATAWLGAHHGEPFFLFVHLWEPHYDYIPPPPYDTLFVAPGPRSALSMEGFYRNEEIHAKMAASDLAYVVAQYDGEIAYADALVGRLLDALEALGLAGETLVAVTADHGDEFFEHGGKGHRHTLYDEVTLVPLIVRGPGVRAGVEIAAPASLIDVAPTLLSMSGLPRHDEMMGEDLAALLAGRAVSERVATATIGGRGESRPLRPAPYAVSELEMTFVPGKRGFCRAFAVRSDRWKTIRDCTDFVEAYDLAADPGERAPIAAPDSGDSSPLAISAALRGAVDRYAAALPRRGARPVKIEKDLEERLRSLGYVE